MSARLLLVVVCCSIVSLASLNHSTLPIQHCLDDRCILSTQLSCSTDGLSDIISSNGFRYPRILIDSSPKIPGIFHPWSLKPFCTTFIAEVNNQLCIYTNQTFARGRGVSIFTTPEIAGSFASLPPFQNPEALDGVNLFSDAWYTSELPGKGTGLLAKRDLNTGDEIAIYTPVFLAHMEQSLSTKERELFFRRAVDQLPVKSRKAYLSLSTIFGEPSVIAQDVLKANTFEVQVGGVMHLALFPETSRMNHDCAPNAQYRIDHDRLTHYVRAVRPIAKGKEITITYTNPLRTTAIRQQALRDAFHFTCRCSRCTAGKSSDAALTRITKLESILGDWTAASPATVELAEELVDLMHKQGLHGFMDTAYGHATLAYNAVGDAEGARRYAMLAVEVIELKDGKGTKNWGMWRELVGQPEGHWSWRFRKS